MNKSRVISQLVVTSLFLFTVTINTAESNSEKPVDKKPKPKIAIIIDDLGHKYNEGVQTIDLEIPLAVAVLPFTPHAKKLAKLAHQKDRDVMLHLPMQPGAAMSLMTDKTLSIHMNQDEFESRIHEAIDDIPHVQGVNNHMGSLFTQLPDQMQWLMNSLQNKSDEMNKELFFIDSFTSQFSIAYQIADQNKIDTARRDVFLDRSLDAEHMQQQIDKLSLKAQKQGFAIAIGHPFPETIALLQKNIPELEKAGFEFVKVSDLIETDMVDAVVRNLIEKNQQQALNSSGKATTSSSQP